MCQYKQETHGKKKHPPEPLTWNLMPERIIEGHSGCIWSQLQYYEHWMREGEPVGKSWNSDRETAGPMAVSSDEQMVLHYFPGVDAIYLISRVSTRLAAGNLPITHQPGLWKFIFAPPRMLQMLILPVMKTYFVQPPSQEEVAAAMQRVDGNLPTQQGQGAAGAQESQVCMQ
ncbi:hypothetical protein M405DRAFT_882990 [Rhizopogon salebrosus TDB-379]|nr:hypothetical protein M405DRAFT_882990 [Rhizopogon salebrosus TDB-379]